MEIDNSGIRDQSGIEDIIQAMLPSESIKRRWGAAIFDSVTFMAMLRRRPKCFSDAGFKVPRIPPRTVRMVAAEEGRDAG